MRDAYGEQPDWASEEAKLLSKASVVALTEFILTRLNLRIEEGFDVTSPEAVEAASRSIVGGIPFAFWARPWNQTELDTSAGRALIQSALKRVRARSSRGESDPLEGIGLLGD